MTEFKQNYLIRTYMYIHVHAQNGKHFPNSLSYGVSYHRVTIMTILQ